MKTPDQINDPLLRPIPRGSNEPLFSEPWEAQVFAIAYRLVAEGHITRSEWAQALGQAIEKAQAEGDPDEGGTYYHHVLVAVESITTDKGLTNSEELESKKQQWIDAYLSTPHGEPVVIDKG